MKFTEEELEIIKKEKMKQIDRWLDNEYGVSYTRLEELHDFVVEQDLKHREEKDKEIERLNNTIDSDNDVIKNQDLEIERLNNIIKEVREYIEQHIKYECDNAFNGMQFYSYHLYDFNKKELLEILDKGE